MSLSAGGKNKALEDALVKEDKLAPILTASKMVSAASNASSAIIQPIVQQPVMLQITEKVSAQVSRDGVIESFDIKGSLTLTAATDEAALCSVQLRLGSVDAFSFSTHPKVNKALYDKSGLLQLKDTTKGFPASRPVGILKWTLAAGNEDLLPIKINCWPEEESRGQMNVSIEYTVDYKIELHDVKIRIPLGTSEAPGIVSIDGSHKHNASTGELVWEIDLIDQSNTSGSLEFNIAQKNGDAFFPISVHFTSHQLFCQLEVSSVHTATGDTPIQYGISKGMSTEDYLIG
jgi:coatomer subunit delta